MRKGLFRTAATLTAVALLPGDGPNVEPASRLENAQLRRACPHRAPVHRCFCPARAPPHPTSRLPRKGEEGSGLPLHSGVRGGGCLGVARFDLHAHRKTLERMPQNRADPIENHRGAIAMALRHQQPSLPHAAKHGVETGGQHVAIAGMGDVAPGHARTIRRPAMAPDRFLARSRPTRREVPALARGKAVAQLTLARRWHRGGGPSSAPRRAHTGGRQARKAGCVCAKSLAFHNANSHFTAQGQRTRRVRFNTADLLDLQMVARSARLNRYRTDNHGG